KIPVAEGRPDEMIEGVGALVIAQVGERDVERLYGLHRLADDPAVDRKRRRGRLQGRGGADAVGLAEARRVPELGGEVAIALDALLIELDVTPLALHRR